MSEVEFHGESIKNKKRETEPSVLGVPSAAIKSVMMSQVYALHCPL